MILFAAKAQSFNVYSLSWVLVGTLLVSCAGHPRPQEFSEQQLANLVDGLAPWPDDSTNYSRRDWDPLISAARIVQETDPESVVQALRRFQRGHAVPPMVDNDGKLLLLMRVVFQLPERESPAGRFHESFGGWITLGADLNSDGTVNLAWPLSWTEGQPRLVSGFIGLQGRRYDAAEEYLYFRDRYSMRRLPRATQGR